jgi:putative heme iron utilization protein
MSDGSRSLRQLLESERHAVLATISARHDSWPFASLTAYASTAHGEPLLLLSDLAEHTRNLRADPRASLLVHDTLAAEDAAAGARVTLIGNAERLADEGAPRDEAQARYLQKNPEASTYLALTDFHFWVLRVAEARFVNGFGAAGWLEGERLSHALLE